MSQNDKSEVARIRAAISEEYEAAQRGLHGYAESASHAFITARLENVGKLHEELKDLVGDQEAAKIVTEAMDAQGGTETLQRLIDEWNAVPSYFERYKRAKEEGKSDE